MNFGVMHWVIGDGKLDAIEAAGERGFDGVELSLAGPEPDDDPVWTSDGRDDLRRAAHDHGVEIASICLGFLNRGGLTSDDPAVRVRATRAMTRSVDAAKALGVDDVLVPFFGEGTIETDEHERRVVEGVREATPSAEAGDVTLAIENTLGADRNNALLDAIDSDSVGVYHDTGNAVFYGNDPVGDMRALGDRMARLHVKDWTGEDSVMLGEGEVDFEAVREAVDDLGYDDWLVLETATEGDQRDDAEANLAFARDALR